MRIHSFWARNYRSLRDMRIDGLGPFNVFYGRNGAGKSNILAGMQALFAFVAARTHSEYTYRVYEPVTADELRTYVTERDRCQYEPLGPIVLGAGISLEPGDRRLPEDARESGANLLLEITSDRPGSGPRISQACYVMEATSTINVLDMSRNAQKGDVEHQAAITLLAVLQGVASHAYAMVDAVRAPFDEILDQSTNLTHLIADGRLKQALFVARNHPQARIRRRYQQLQDLLAGEPLSRPSFEPTYDPRTQRVDLVEYLDDSVDQPKEVSLDLLGLGIAQIYSILGQILFSDAAAVGIEEPEAHLHAPTTGMHLRRLLVRLVEEGYLSQLFIATHSNLFDLDPEGYLDVEHQGERGTVVTRRDLSEIDRRHLYEPGPAKHALRVFLDTLEPDDIVFRTADGSPVSVREMLDLLQRDDPLAKSFLEDVHGAAVRAVRVKSKRRGDA